MPSVSGCQALRPPSYRLLDRPGHTSHIHCSPEPHPKPLYYARRILEGRYMTSIALSAVASFPKWRGPLHSSQFPSQSKFSPTIGQPKSKPVSIFKVSAHPKLWQRQTQMVHLGIPAGFCKMPLGHFFPSISSIFLPSGIINPSASITISCCKPVTNPQKASYPFEEAHSCQAWLQD